MVNGRLVFDRRLLDSQDFLSTPSVFFYQNVHGREKQIDLQAISLAYTICQTAVVLEIADEMGIIVLLSDGTQHFIQGNILDEENSRHVFQRDGCVQSMFVTFPSP